jgi:hypothetical protein
VISGAVAGLGLAFGFSHLWIGLLIGVSVGTAYSAAIRPVGGDYQDGVMRGGSLGIPLWGLVSVIAMPLLSGQMPQWTAEEMREHFPALVGWVI